MQDPRTTMNGVEGLQATGIELRPARSGDADLIWRTLCLAASWNDRTVPHKLPGIAAAYYENWGRPDDIGVLAFLGIEFVGGVYGRRVSPADGTYGYVEPDLLEIGIGIEPPHRGRGLGRLLLESLKAKTLERGVPGLSLSVETTNVRARALYASANFSIVEEGPTDVLMVWRNVAVTATE